MRTVVSNYVLEITVNRVSASLSFICTELSHTVEQGIARIMSSYMRQSVASPASATVRERIEVGGKPLRGDNLGRSIYIVGELWS